MRIAMTLLTVALAAAGCTKKSDDHAAGPAGSGSAAMNAGPANGSGSAAMAAGPANGSGSGAMGSGSAAAGSDTGSAAAGSAAGSGAGDDAVTMAHHAGNCPSTVLGATTKAAIKGDDVVVTITSTDKDAIA